MGSSNGVEVTTVLHVLPSNPSDVLISLPFTFIDLMYFNFPPTKRLFFYEHPNLSPTIFSGKILPELQISLSNTLNHFLPLAGKVTWPSNSERPIIQYNKGDSVLLYVADCHNPQSFDYLSGDHARENILLDSLATKLPVSDTEASAIALQVTFFPNKGYTIALTYQHSVLDGKASTLFMNAWAYMCKSSQENQDVVALPQALTPIFNRDVFKDPNFIKQLVQGIKSYTNGSPKFVEVEPPQGLLKSTFKFTKGDISNLRSKIESWNQKLGKEKVHYSSFVVTTSYLMVCMLRSKGCEKVYLKIPVDYGARLDPPVPKNYCGNCAGLGAKVIIEAKNVMQEYGIAIVAEMISGAIKEFVKTLGEEDGTSRIFRGWTKTPSGPGLRPVTMSGSPRFEVYSTDFGYGKPKKVELLSTDETGVGSTESRDEKGGVEVCLVMSKSELDNFTAQFHSGLKTST